MAQGSSVTYRSHSLRRQLPNDSAACAQGDDFGVRRGILVAERAVLSAPQNPVAAHHQRADRHVARHRRLARQIERLTHQRDRVRGAVFTRGRPGRLALRHSGRPGRAAPSHTDFFPGRPRLR